MRSAISQRLGAFGQALAFLALVSCGGGGGGSSTPPTPASKVFFTDGGNGAIVSSSSATPTTTFPIDRVVEGPHTGLPSSGILAIPSITLDTANNRLYVATQGNTFVYNNISTANGDVPPNATLSAIINTGGIGFRGVSFWYNALDNTRGGMLYSVDFTGEVHVFNNPLTATGTVNRIISPDLGTAVVSSSFGLALDAARDMLYVGLVFGTGANIIVFNNASTIGTTVLAGFPPPVTTLTPVAPDRTLSFAQPIVSVYLDTTNDRLYTSHTDGIVRVFDNAHTLLTGAPTPDRTIDLGGSTPIDAYIFVDTSRDKLYAVASNTGNQVGVFGYINNASTATSGIGTFFSFSPVPGIALTAVAVAP